MYTQHPVTPATDFQNEGPAQTLAVGLAEASSSQRSGGGSGGGSGTGGGRWTTSAWLQFISADLSCLHQIITKQDACISNTSHFFLFYLFKGYSSLFRKVQLIRRFVNPKVRYSEGALFRRFVIPKVRYSDGSLIRR